LNRSRIRKNLKRSATLGLRHTLRLFTSVKDLQRDVRKPERWKGKKMRGWHKREDRGNCLAAIWSELCTADKKRVSSFRP